MKKNKRVSADYVLFWCGTVVSFCALGVLFLAMQASLLEAPSWVLTLTDAKDSKEASMRLLGLGALLLSLSGFVGLARNLMKDDALNTASFFMIVVLGGFFFLYSQTEFRF